MYAFYVYLSLSISLSPSLSLPPSPLSLSFTFAPSPFLSFSRFTVTASSGLMCNMDSSKRILGEIFLSHVHDFLSLFFLLLLLFLFQIAKPATPQNDNFRCSEMENLLFITRDRINLWVWVICVCMFYLSFVVAFALNFNIYGKDIPKRF